jgi:hypothetical protein
MRRKIIVRKRGGLRRYAKRWESRGSLNRTCALKLEIPLFL